MQQRIAKQINTFENTLFADRATFAWLFAYDNVWNNCDVNINLPIEQDLYITKQDPQRRHLTLTNQHYLGGAIPN